ncbi:MAG: methionyl-tRNA formyltransferase [Acutalibacteraceae bacterium]|nr:methionyl-tRNA formyltransferase [Acutalibacteraceae bacterium]
MNVVYMGTPEFAVLPLDAIIKAGHNVTGVFTQPDKPKGRGYTLTPPPVKVRALENEILVFQPTSMKDGEALKILEELNPDVIVVVAYGKILPKAILDLPKYGCVNVHASLLPKYRGAGPIQWCVLNGEEETGVTTMKMAEGLDTGDMLLKSATKIGENETAGELHDRLSQMGADLIVDTLTALENDSVVPEKQDDSLSNYAPMLTKELCKIDWNKSAQEIHNQVRGLNPWPVATAVVNGKKVKVFATTISEKNGEAGKVLCENPLTVACGEKSLVIHELQLEGKKRMKSDDFVRGYRITTDTVFE